MKGVLSKVLKLLFAVLLIINAIPRAIYAGDEAPETEPVEEIVEAAPVAEEPAELPWEYIYKVANWKGYLLIYSNRVNAYIIPIEAIKAEYTNITDYIKAHVEDYKLKIK